MVRLPDDVSELDAAAVLLKGLTAWMLLFEARRASPGETALVWAPAGGVGSLLVPWASSLGVSVIAVTSSNEKAVRSKELGAQHTVLSSSNVVAEVMELTNGEGVDVSFDSVGKTSAHASLNCLKPRGWWISYGNASGPAEAITPVELGEKGSLVLTRPNLFNFTNDSDSMRRGAAALFGAMRAGTIKSNIGRLFALCDVADAHQALENGKTIGSTLLLPQNDETCLQ